MIAFDQRGCGRSTPRGVTLHNHTAALLEDIEALRHALGIERWLVAGGSWGATLAAAYAAGHRARVAGVLLRGLFVPERAELEWFFQGARALFPLQWEAFAAAAPRRARRDLLAWLVRVFAGDDAAGQARAALAWLAGNAPSPVRRRRRPPMARRSPEPSTVTRCRPTFFRGAAGWTAPARRNACARLAGLPVLFLHGAADLVCRPGAAWQAQRCAAGSGMGVGARRRPRSLPPGHGGCHGAGLDAFAVGGRFDDGEG